MSQKTAPLKTALLKTDVGDIPLMVRVSPRARRIGLRVDPRIGGAELVLPKGVSTKKGLNFAATKSDWLWDHIAALPKPIPFIDGSVIPVMGLTRRIRHEGAGRPCPGLARGPVWLSEDFLHVRGEEPHLARRLKDWLKAEAKREITARAMAAADTLGLTVRRITLRDPKSRWGSCSTNGNLSFSWRLILAPESVLHYVVCHEVAHLAEMNHGPKFWKLVGKLVNDSQMPRDWLRLHGVNLHRYG